MGSYTPNSKDGRRLLPVCIDEAARDEPNRPCFSLPRTDSDLSQGYLDVNFATFANCINQLALLIDRAFGRSDTFQAIAYMGAPDIRYHFVQMAAVKTGYQVLFSSHSNSLAGHLSLMETCDCKFVLCARGIMVDDILASRAMQHAMIPDLDDLLAASPVKHYPYEKSFEEAAQDPYLIVHTSGSTGFPKPIPWNHGATASQDAHKNLAEVDEVSGMRRSHTIFHAEPQRILVPFLPFHAASSVVMMISVVFRRRVYVVGFRHRILERGDLFNVLEHANVKSGLFSPAMLEDLAAHPRSPEYLKQMSSLTCAGASLNHATGSFISKYTRLYNLWGATELGKPVELETDPEDFEYCAWDLEKNGLEFKHLSEDIYEMILHRTASSYPYSAVFHREPRLASYKSGDLWTPHPDPRKAGHVWKFFGRTDDLISYQDGNNFHPSVYELKHCEHDLIRSAALAGNGHRQPVLLLELSDPCSAITPAQNAQTIDRLWKESVTPINDVAPKNGQVAKTHIIIAHLDKPFERNAKGTLARKATLKNYEAEIESIYQQFGDVTMDLRERFGLEENQHNHQ